MTTCSLFCNCTQMSIGVYWRIHDMGLDLWLPYVLHHDFIAKTYFLPIEVTWRIYFFRVPSFEIVDY